MPKEFNFIDSSSTLLDSIIEFASKQEFYKEVLRSSPKYFVHVKYKNKHLFGLSKFCAFKNISVEEYISTYRYKTSGGTTQKHISKILGQNWTPRNKITEEIRVAFDKWIFGFFPNYTLDNASFISIKSKAISPKRKKLVSAIDLEASLKLQSEIGKVGEQIAFDYEINRLFEQGIKNPNAYINHTSKENIFAGFDIYSSIKNETRYIEVKSSLKGNIEFFITENEVQTLRSLGKEAFLYLVIIKDLRNKKGKVYKIINNPISLLEKKGALIPVAYKASIKNDF